ncbi:hypothetical protein Acr_29g0006620 [Actinidia rufa]|uniref:DUF4283 domain-containing protein n=1 Tax=Actinidia rufa TaxID=165716 RepID=A0A7J0HEF1_9ERIC|nr:hypothetical protein Acr_29g0006620 [Actinidia rufa]
MAKKNKRKDGGNGPTSKLEEDPILAKLLARTDMGSSEGQTSAILIRHVEIEGRSIAVMIPNEAYVDTEADVDFTEDLSNAQSNPISSQVVKGKSFANLFEKNRLSTIGSKLEYYNLGEGPIQIREEDTQLSDCPWEKCLVGYFGGKFPGKHALNQIIASWKVHPTFQFHGSGWIVFRFDSTEDHNKVLENGPYMIYGSPLLLKLMTKSFSFGKEAINTFLVWVQLRNVPLTLWNPIIFGMICSRLRRPIHMDRLTTSKERITYARCLAEVGHTKENCKAKQAGNTDKGGKTAATDSGKQPTTSDAGEDTRGEWVIKQNTAISTSEEPVGCSVEKETAIQELTHNPGSTPVNLESVLILPQPPPKPTHPQESYPILDNQTTEHRLTHPQESIREIPSST